jgi:hypothetical protein
LGQQGHSKALKPICGEGMGAGIQGQGKQGEFAVKQARMPFRTRPASAKALRFRAAAFSAKAEFLFEAP